jgi:enterochelin esterase-like enzyme
MDQDYFTGYGDAIACIQKIAKAKAFQEYVTEVARKIKPRFGTKREAAKRVVAKRIFPAVREKYKESTRRAAKYKYLASKRRKS